MATVAIIHAAEDALPARALAEKLRQTKLTVVLEKPAGEETRSAVKDAKVTVALWSPRSNAQQGLIEDAQFAKGKTKLLHACMQNAAAPDAFRSDKIVNLTGWRGEDDFPAWLELAKLVTDRAGVAPLPPPAPKPPSGFFQPGVVREAQPAAAGAAARGAAPARQSAPPPRAQAAPRQAAATPRPAAAPPRAPAEPAAQKSGGGGRMALIAIVTFVIVAVIGGGGYFFWSQSQSADASASAWQGVDANSADAIRAFLDGDPGEYRDEAQQALAELEERSYEAASDADTIEAFEAFLNDFPDSDHALAARGRIAELQSMQPAATPVPPADPNAPPTTTPNPDLVPPGSTTTAPAPAAPPATGGPAPITPPAEQTPTEPSTTP
jgi:hypothetical protein